MAKDAKGHGSEKRGGGSAAGDIAARLGLRPEIASAVTRAAHTAGINKIGQPAPDIKSTIYNFARKMPGYNGRVTPLNADRPRLPTSRPNTAARPIKDNWRGSLVFVKR